MAALFAFFMYAMTGVGGGIINVHQPNDFGGGVIFSQQQKSDFGGGIIF